MKTLRTLVTALLFSWVAKASALAAPAPPAMANFVGERGQVFGLVLDGQPLTRPVARQVHVDWLAPGQHWADISVPTPYGPPMRFRTALWLEPGLETSYVLVVRPGRIPQLRQLGAVAIGRPAYGPQGGYGGYPPQSQGPAPYNNGQGGYNGQQGSYNGQQGGYYNGYPTTPGNTPYNGNPSAADGPGAAGGYHPTAPAPAPRYPGGYAPNATPEPDPNAGSYDPGQNNGNYPQPLPPADVQDLTEELRTRASDNERLPIVKEALAQGTVRADELAQLMATLSFNKSRIDLAEYGYAHLSDPQNFNQVYEVLRYPASIQEVQQALGLPQQ